MLIHLIAPKRGGYVDSLGGKRTFFFLRPHLPEHNPYEFVWDDAKNSRAGRSVGHDPRICFRWW
jgi:transposase